MSKPDLTREYRGGISTQEFFFGDFEGFSEREAGFSAQYPELALPGPAVDYEKRRITFIHKSRVDRRGRKSFATVTLDVFEFMARMLYYLPDRHEKTVRYYGIYAQSKRRGMHISTGATWSTAIRTCFHNDPELCPDCGAVMAARVVFAFSADVMMRRLQGSHALVQGYFRRRPP